MFKQKFSLEFGKVLEISNGNFIVRKNINIRNIHWAYSIVGAVWCEEITFHLFCGSLFSEIQDFKEPDGVDPQVSETVTKILFLKIQQQNALPCC